MKIHVHTLLATLLAFVAIVLAAGDQLQADLVKLDKRATTLKKALVKTNGNNLLSALGIAFNAFSLDSAITSSTKAAKTMSSPMSEQDADASLKTLKGTSSSVSVIVERLLAIHDNWQRLPFVLIVADPTVKRAATHTQELSVALIDKMPESRKVDMKMLAGKINGDLARAVAAYGGGNAGASDGNMPQQGQGGMPSGGSMPTEGDLPSEEDAPQEDDVPSQGDVPSEEGRVTKRLRRFGRRHP